MGQHPGRIWPVDEATVRPSYRTIREISEDDRPRERLLKHGPDVLSDSELVAILLGSGLRGENVLDMSRSLLEGVGGLANLVRSDTKALLRMRGLGPAKASQLLAALELGRRAQQLDPDARPLLKTPEAVFGYLGARLGALPREQLHVIAVDTKGRLLGAVAQVTGTISALNVRPGEVFREAVVLNADGVIFVHNHPSGDPRPSPQDVRTTQELVAAGEVLEIEVLDHVIIGQGRFCSMKKEGYGFSRS